MGRFNVSHVGPGSSLCARERVVSGEAMRSCGAYDHVRACAPRKHINLDCEKAFWAVSGACTHRRSPSVMCSRASQCGGTTAQCRRHGHHDLANGGIRRRSVVCEHAHHARIIVLEVLCAVEMLTVSACEISTRTSRRRAHLTSPESARRARRGVAPSGGHSSAISVASGRKAHHSHSGLHFQKLGVIFNFLSDCIAPAL